MPTGAYIRMHDFSFFVDSSKMCVIHPIEWHGMKWNEVVWKTIAPEKDDINAKLSFSRSVCVFACDRDQVHYYVQYVLIGWKCVLKLNACLNGRFGMKIETNETPHK